MILLAALLLAVPIGIVLAEMPGNPSNAADSSALLYPCEKEPVPVNPPEPGGPSPAGPPELVPYSPENRFEIGDPAREGAPAKILPEVTIPEHPPRDVTGDPARPACGSYARVDKDPGPATWFPTGPGKEEVGIAATSHLTQRSLNAGAGHQWGPWFFTAGEIVVISIAWTPRFSDTELGVVFQPTGEFISLTRTWGAGTVVMEIFQSGYFYVRIHNRGPHLIWYCGYKTI